MTKKKGTFKKGYDPRRIGSEGLTEYRQNLRELMKDRAHEAVEFMFEVLNDKTAGNKLRMAAAQDIQDRYYGKSIDRIAIATLDSSSSQDTAAMTDQELQSVINRLVHKPDDNCIDSESITIEEDESL